MPNIEGYKLTNKGNALQIKVEAGKCKLNITKLKLGSGTASGDIVNLTDLVQVEQTVPISKIEVVDDYTCRITGLVTNQGLNKIYYIREIGLYAQDPDDGEILYLVAVDKNPDVMPADNYQMIISQEFNIDVVVSNVDSVNVTSQPVHLVTSDEVDEKIEEHNTSANPHENIFKRVLITEAKTAANTADWNTLTESRTYKITGATFAVDKHQPVGAVGTGELVVLKNGDDTIAQVYYANSAAYDKAGAYHRMCIGGAWTDWVYNITNKGGVVTGDFNINGKLTVKEVQVTDRLLIGEVDPAKPDTSNFLTKDDLQKLQNQIINPNQTIYVDSIRGSDDSAESDGSSNKPFKTLDKAASAIKNDVKTINIILANDVDGEEYPFTNTCFLSKNNEKIYITNKNYQDGINKIKRAVMIPAFIKYYTNNRNDYIVGYILIKGFQTVTLDGIKIKYSSDTNITDKYSTQMIQGVTNFSGTCVDITLIDKSIFVAPTSMSSFVIDDSKITGTDTSYLLQGNILVTTIKNLDNDESNWTTWLNSSNYVLSNLSQSRSSITGINSEKIKSDCHALYSNIV